MKFDVEIVLIILGFSIKKSKGYVSGVNPRLTTTESTVIQPNVDFKMERHNFVESTSPQNSKFTATSDYYDDSRIFFPSPSDNVYPNERSSTANQEQTRHEIATSFPTYPNSNNQNTGDLQLSKLTSVHPFERDDDEDRPIWSS